jgi:hypothetical protein
MVATVNTVWYVNYGDGATTGYFALTKWAANTAYTVGQVRRQNATPTVLNERCFVCVVAGTSNAVTEPTWVITRGGKTTEAGGVVWMECSGKAAVNGDATNVPLSSGQRSQTPEIGNIITNNAGTFLFICTTSGACGAGEPTYNTTTGATTTDSSAVWTCIGSPGANGSGSFGKWAAPIVRMPNLANFITSNAGNTVYFSSIHVEITTGSVAAPGTSSVPMKWLCVGQSGNIPPTGADVTTGASVTASTGSFAISSCQVYSTGISYTAAAATSLIIGNGVGDIVIMENGALNLTSSGGTGPLYLSHNGATSRIELKNVTIQINNSASSYITPAHNVRWRDTASAISKVAGGSWPTTLFKSADSSPPGEGVLLIENVDLSAFGGTQYFGAGLLGRVVMNKCKLSSSAVCNATIDQGLLSGTVDAIDCDSGGLTYRHERWSYPGNQVVSASAVRTGGASNGTTSYSWLITTTANSQWLFPFEALPMVIWNTSTAADVTVTLHGCYNGTALPNNDDIWLDVGYFGTSSSTAGSRKTATKANFLTTGAALTADTGAAWDTAATARGNTTAYVLGNLISVASAAAGQLYICVTAGTTAGSVPGGYAANADGASVTDGTAVFRALMRFSMAVTLTSPQPQSAGYLNVGVYVAKLSSTFFVDPLPVLS